MNEFEWDEDNVEHVEEHGVALEEVEEALADPDRVGVPAYNTSRERRPELSARQKMGASSW